MSSKVMHTYNDHLITRQNRAEKEFLAAFEAEKPTLENAHVLVNPYFINPLCALILFKSEKPAVATMTIHGKRNDRENIVHTFPEGTSHVIPVIGLYEGMATRVTVELSTGESKTFSIESQPLPEDVCRCRNINTSMDYFGNNFMFLTPAGKNLPTAYDYMGDIRWLLTENTMFDIKRVKNGNIMTGSHHGESMPHAVRLHGKKASAQPSPLPDPHGNRRSSFHARHDRHKDIPVTAQGGYSRQKSRRHLYQESPGTSESGLSAPPALLQNPAESRRTVLTGRKTAATRHPATSAVSPAVRAEPDTGSSLVHGATFPLSQFLPCASPPSSPQDNDQTSPAPLAAHASDTIDSFFTTMPGSMPYLPKITENVRPRPVLAIVFFQKNEKNFQETSLD